MPSKPPAVEVPAPRDAAGVADRATRWPVLALLGLAVAAELVLTVGWLRPLALWRHQANPPDGAPMVTILGRTRDGALQFAVPAVILCALYAAAVWLAPRTQGRLATAVALGAPLVFAATLVPMFPGGTQDIFHNVADGRLLWLHGENPTLVPPIAHPEDAFYPHLFGYVDLTSAYGPLWYLLAGLPIAVAGDGFVANVVAQKALMSAFFLATVALIWAVVRTAFGGGGQPDRDAVRKAEPWEDDQHLPLPPGGERAAVRGDRPTAANTPVAAAVILGWCPLLLWELAGNGHNDAIMVLFAAAAVAAAAWRWWLWVFPLLALSVLVKLTTLLLGPVLLVWLWRRPDVPRRAIFAGLGIAALLVAVAYVPFWAGADTFTFLHRPGMTFILSPATLLDRALTGPLGEHPASRLTYALTGALFAVLYGWALVRARGGTVSLLDAGFDGLFAYLVFASWWFWPWYLSWLAPLPAWRAGHRRAWVFVLMTSTALLTYPYWWSDPPERSGLWFTWYTLITTGVFAAPLALWLRSGGPAGALPGRVTNPSVLAQPRGEAPPSP